MAYIPSSSGREMLLNAIVAYLVQEYGEATEDWKSAYIKIPDGVLNSFVTADQIIDLSVDVSTLSTVVSVTLPQEEEKEAEPFPTPAKKPRQEQSSSTTGICRNCGKSIYKKKSWTSVWYHNDSKNSACAENGTWARPKGR